MEASKEKKKTLFDQVKNLGDIDFVTLQIEFLSAEGKNYTFKIFF